MDSARTTGLESSATEGGPDEDAKVIVRSNGTVTYVGKDIAYHLWKFGLLGRDFGYKKFFAYPDHECWISAEQGEADHPQFGGANAIYNVIDVRQTDPQANLVQALRGMGFVEQADHCIHFGYEKVALTRRCALELGYEIDQEDLNSPYILVSGRKGFGVKADDLIDKLIAAVQPLVDEKQAASSEFVPPADRHADRHRSAALFHAQVHAQFCYRFRLQRRAQLRRRDRTLHPVRRGSHPQHLPQGGNESEAALQELASRQVSESASQRSGLATFLTGQDNEDIWALWLRAGRFSLVLDQCIAASEPAYLAKHAFQLAQEFANFYHKHHILTEEDPARKTFLLATAAVTLRELVRSLALLGIESPEAM